MTQLPPREPSPLDTAEYSFQEILERLELGRLVVEATEAGSRLVVNHADAPPSDRRTALPVVPVTVERRTYRPVALPTLFPERGPIHLLLVGGFASEQALPQAAPYWRDDLLGGQLVWQALRGAGLLHPADADSLLGLGGAWDPAPPRTLGLAMTYAAFRPLRASVAFDHVVHPWNLQRLETLVEACWSRSEERLAVVTLGEAARLLLCAGAFGRQGPPVLSLPEPPHPGQEAGPRPTAAAWLEWASDLLSIGRA